MRPIPATLAVLILAPFATCQDRPYEIFPLPESDRLAAVKEFRDAYDAKKKAIENQIDRAKTSLKFKETAAAGKVDLKRATDALAELAKNPFHALPVTEAKRNPLAGTICTKFPVETGVVVNGVHDHAAYFEVEFLETKNTSRVEPLSKQAKAEAKAKHAVKLCFILEELDKAETAKGAKIKLDGLFLAAGPRSYNGKTVYIFHRINIKPDEMPN